MSIGVSLEGLQKTFDAESLGNAELTHLIGSFEGFRVRIEQDRANQALIKTLLTDVKAAIDAENKQLAAFAEHRLGELGGHGEKSITIADVSNALKDIRDQAESPEARIGALNDFAENKLPEMLADFGDKIRDKLSDSEITSIVKTVTDRIGALKDDLSIPGEKLQSKAQALVQTYLDKVVTIKSLVALQVQYPINGDFGKTEITSVLNLSPGQDSQKIQEKANKQFIESFKKDILQLVEDKSLISFIDRSLGALGTVSTMEETTHHPITFADMNQQIETLIAHCEDSQERKSVFDAYWKNTLPRQIDAFEKETGLTLSSEQKAELTRNLKYHVGPQMTVSMKNLKDAIERVVVKHLDTLKRDLALLKQHAAHNPAFIDHCTQNLLASRSPFKPVLFEGLLKTAMGFKPDSFKQFLLNIDAASPQDKMMMFGGFYDQVVNQTKANLPPGGLLEFGADEEQSVQIMTLLYQLTMPDASDPSFKSVLSARLNQIEGAKEEIGTQEDVLVGNASLKRNATAACGLIAMVLKSQVDPAEIVSTQLTFDAIHKNPNMLPNECRAVYNKAVQQIKDAIAKQIPNPDTAQKAIKQAIFSLEAFLHQKGIPPKHFDLAVDNVIQLSLQIVGVKTPRCISVPGIEFSNEDQNKLLKQCKGAFFAEFVRQMYLNLAPNQNTGKVEFGNQSTKYSQDAHRQKVFLPNGERLSKNSDQAREQLLEFLTGKFGWDRATEQEKRTVALFFSTLQQNTMTVFENASSSISGTGMGYLQHFEPGGDVTRVPPRAYYVQKDPDGGVSILQHDMVRPDDTSQIVIPSKELLAFGTFRSSTSIRFSPNALKQIGEIDWSDPKFSENIPAETDFTQGLPKQFTGLASAKGVYDELGCSFVSSAMFSSP